MKRLIAPLLGAFALLSSCAKAVEPQAFDYWILSLSWSPQYCAGEARPKDPQCAARRYGFIVHGLWPQNERANPNHSPKNCPQPDRLPQRFIDRMLPLMPSPGLIQHEWSKHGACTGWPADQYFDAVEQAYRSIKIPAAYAQLDDYLSTDLSALEQEFMRANPGYSAEALATQCSGQYLKEIRLCMDKDFHPRTCGPDVRDRCLGQVVIRPVK